VRVGVRVRVRVGVRVRVRVRARVRVRVRVRVTSMVCALSSMSSTGEALLAGADTTGVRSGDRRVRGTLLGTVPPGAKG